MGAGTLQKKCSHCQSIDQKGGSPGDKVQPPRPFLTSILWFSHWLNQPVLKGSKAGAVQRGLTPGPRKGGKGGGWI